MVWLRKLLFPFSVLYDAATRVRNRFYDNQIFKSASFSLPVIAVGNLSMGGTGKTPMIEYLIRLLDNNYKTATLSRGYKRKSEGFVLANAASTAETIGDEPMQFHLKFPKASVAVDADRKRGITKLIELAAPDVILLDDAFQHRKVKAGFYILLTAYGDLYCDDLVLPAGNLRESSAGAARADAVIVTKCPADLSEEEMQRISKKLRLPNVFFTAVAYGDEAISAHQTKPVSEVKQDKKLLLAGIAKPKPFFDYLKAPGDVTLKFPDHHSFSAEDLALIVAKSDGNPIITTEKDYVRLAGKLPSDKLFYLPIGIKFLKDKDEFDNLILNYVGRSTTNG